MRNIPVSPIVHRQSFTRSTATGFISLVGTVLALASPASLQAAAKPDGAQIAEPPAIVIRPANYDKADELAYTRMHGDVAPGMVPDGSIWNRPPIYALTMPFRAYGSSVATIAPTAARAAADAQSPVASAPAVLPMTYAQAYAQIPFSRSEYEANPSYRHDAAMEILFGQMRPTVISRTTTPYFSRYPDFFRYAFPVYPYR